jgi:hypothetical protein
MSSVPIVAGFTSVKPEHRIPYRYGEFGRDFYPVTVPNLDCNGCQSSMYFVVPTTHDFRLCYFGDYRCVKELTADLYWDKLKPLITEEK